jgi:hypothetical protein
MNNPDRTLLLLAIIAAAGMLPGAARAQNYPWCSNFADGAGTNCGFATEQQCRITIQGSGGYCDRNNLYKPTAAAPAPGQRRQRPNKHS